MEMIEQEENPHAGNLSVTRRRAVED